MSWSKGGSWKATLARACFQLYSLSNPRQEPQSCGGGWSWVKESSWRTRAPHRMGVAVGVSVPRGAAQWQSLGTACGRP